MLFHGEVRDLTPSPDGSRVAYVSGTPNTVYVARADGSGRIKVAAGSQPCWSPDGRQLVFVGRGGQLLASADGGGIRALGATGNLRRPAWSPTGGLIAFVDTGHAHLDVIRPDGTGRKTIADDANDEPIAWSASGRWIAFSASSNESAHLDVVRSDGSDRRAIGEGFFGSRDAPVWAPTDDRLAFRSDGRLRIQAPSGEPVLSLEADGAAAWSPDGRRLAVGDRELTVVDTHTGTTKSLGAGGQPRWSPDGTTIAYTRNGRLWTIPAGGGARRVLAEGVSGAALWLRGGRVVYEARRLSRWEIVTAGSTGGGVRVLKRAPARFEGPQEFAELTWSPDGSRLSYVRDPGKTHRLEVVRASGGASRLVATHAGGAAWSPDGTSIAYSRGGIHVIRLGDGAPKRLTRGDDGMAAWSPSGRSIGFVRSGDEFGALHIVPAEGGPLRRLVRDGVGSFSWSPDGGRIAFDDGARAIGVIAVTGRNVRRVAVGDEDEETGEFVWRPRWSPDGTRIVYSSEQLLCGSKCSEFRLALVSPTGRATRDLPHLDEVEWSPDGRFLLGLEDSDGGALTTIDSRTGRARTVAAFATSASWQPLPREKR